MPRVVADMWLSFHPACLLPSSLYQLPHFERAKAWEAVIESRLRLEVKSACRPPQRESSCKLL